MSSCVMLCFHEKMWGLTNCPGASGRGGAHSCWCDPGPPETALSHQSQHPPPGEPCLMPPSPAASGQVCRHGDTSR